MAFTGVLITLPNAPGLVGQFHAGILLALAAYLPESVLTSAGGAYAHRLQASSSCGTSFSARPAAVRGEAAGSLRPLVIDSTRPPSKEVSDGILPHWRDAAWPDSRSRCSAYPALPAGRVPSQSSPIPSPAYGPRRAFPARGPWLPHCEKDESAGYILFDPHRRSQAVPGILELIRVTDAEGRDATRLAVTIPDLPHRYEQMLLDKLTVKVREDHGPAAPPPRKPEPPKPDAGHRRHRRRPSHCRRLAQFHERLALFDEPPGRHMNRSHASETGASTGISIFMDSRMARSDLLRLVVEGNHDLPNGAGDMGPNCGGGHGTPELSCCFAPD